MSQQPLQQRVRQVAAKATRLRWLLCLSWLTVALLAALLTWGTIDYLLHVADAGVRAIASGAILGLLGYLTWRWLWPAWQARTSDLAVAQRIEQHFPELGDRLSSSLAFAEEDETTATAGSATLRRAVIADTMARTELLDFTQVIDSQPTRRAVGVASLLLIIAVAITVWQPQATWLVLQRTAWPWTKAAWPRRHALAFEKPVDKLATGADFEVNVVDEQGQLPDEVTIWYWFDGEREDQAQAREMKLLGGKMVHRLENVTRSFRYRAVGGDDDRMPWQSLYVLEPPRITAIQVQVTPPPYTGWPQEQVSPDFRALVGSQVQLTAKVDKPIKSAQLKLEGATKQSAVQIAVGSDGTSLQLPASAEQPWILAPANAYTLELTSLDGLTSHDARYEIRVVPDRPPTVMVEKPVDNALVTPQALLPLRAQVKDDLAIAKVELRYLRSDATGAGEQVVDLYVGPAQVATLATNPLGEGQLSGDSRIIEYAWNMADIPDLKPGLTLTWHIAAYDYLSQSCVSTAQRIMVISSDELEERIAQRQSAILAQLHEVLRQQVAARGQVSSLQVQLQALQRLGKQDLDALLAAELNQRQVLRGLNSEADGVLTQIASLLADLEINRLDSPDVARRMQELATEIRRLTKEPLPVIERSLTTAQKLVRDDLDKHGDLPTDGSAPAFDVATRDGTRHALDHAGQHQDEVIASLEQLLGDLSQWDNYRRFAREMSRLRSDQEGVRKQTQELQPQTLSKLPRDLTPVEAAAIKRLAQRQTELSRQFDKLLGRMNEAQGTLRENQPLAAETIADALDAARRLGISTQMLDAARGIERNQLGTAGEGQDEIANALGEMLDILANRKEHELSRRLKQLNETAEELDALAQQLRGTRNRLQSASKIGNEAERRRQLERLTKEQQRLAEAAQRAARRLERLQAEQAGAATSQAGEKLSQSGEASQKGAAEKALEEAAQAQQHLDEARQKLKQDITQTQQDLFFEQVAKLEQAIKGLVDRQQAVVTETARLEGLKHNQQGEWTPSQQTSVRTVAEQERDLVVETTGFAQKLAQAQAFGLALQGAVREMTRAAARLDKLQTDAETQNAEQIALTRLQQLLEALKPEPPMAAQEQPPPPADNGNQGDQPPAMPPGEALNLLAELKLLKLMQAEINRRTGELEKLRKGTELSADQQKELADLALEQGKLADLVLRLVEEAAKRAAQPAGTKPAETPANPLDQDLEKALDN